MQTKSKTVLILTDRKGGTIKRSLIKKAVAETYNRLGLEPIWDGRVSKRIVKIR